MSRSRRRETGDIEIAEFVRENREEIAHVLRHSQDPYTRACALVLIREGGTKRDIEKIKEELDRCV